MIVKEVNQGLVELKDFSEAELQLLQKKLRFRNKANTVAYLKFKNAIKYNRTRLSNEQITEKLNEFKENEFTCLVLNKKDRFFTYKGLYRYIKELIPDNEYIPLNLPDVKAEKKLRWNKEPLEPRYYQQEAFDALIKGKHGAISLPTGSGKSLIIAMLAQHYSLKTLIMVPTDNIGSQLYNDLTSYFGTHNIGMFGGGKKEYNKLITVAIDKSLLRVEKDTPQWEEFSKTHVVIIDESHMVATSVQEQVLLSLFVNARYRFFLSATQFRNDGSDLLLEGITNDVLYSADFRKLVKEGYLAEPHFKTLIDNKSYKDVPKDPLRALDKIFYKNASIHKTAATLANKLVNEDNLNVLLMVDRISQFSLLHRYLKIKDIGFAYGNLTKEQKAEIPAEFHKLDSFEEVDRFNSGKIKLLIGTRAIGMGTDTRPVDVIINLQGGQSDNKFMQLIGRGTRIVKGKTKFDFYDFAQVNHDLMNKWAISRQQLFKQLSDKVLLLK